MRRAGRRRAATRTPSFIQRAGGRATPTPSPAAEGTPQLEEERTQKSDPRKDEACDPGGGRPVLLVCQPRDTGEREPAGRHEEYDRSDECAVHAIRRHGNNESRSRGEEEETLRLGGPRRTHGAGNRRNS